MANLLCRLSPRLSEYLEYSELASGKQASCFMIIIMYIPEYRWYDIEND